MARSVFDPHFGEQEPIWLPINMDIISGALREWFIQSGDYDAAIRFIVATDLAMANWEETEKLIAHFKALELEMMKEEGCGPVEPKKIES